MSKNVPIRSVTIIAAAAMNAAVLCMAGCSGTGVSVPQLGNATNASATTTAATPLTSSGSPGASTTATTTPITAVTKTAVTTPCSTCRIVGFKPAVVTLYLSPTGQDAQRVPKTALALPIVATGDATDRLQIMTLDGVRWVAANEVQVASDATR